MSNLDLLVFLWFCLYEVSIVSFVFEVDDESYTVILPETDHFLNFLQQLSDMGAAMRTVITKTVCDSDLYRRFCDGIV